MRRWFFAGAGLILAFNIFGYFFLPWINWSLVVVVPALLLGLYDVTQKKHTILRNFPVIGHFRYWLEMLGPEINQYFIESNTDGVPFSRDLRSVVYQRAKKQTDTLPFGTQKNVYETGYEWANHSMMPIDYKGEMFRVTIGGPGCKLPYSASIFNISAMSYGAISKTAVLAFNGGARLGRFYQNTGEGGLSPYHLEPGGDVVWQIGTGYFGCRTADGNFDEKSFQEKANHMNVKMIEIKLSQGAKPGHGGILPAAKVTSEIAQIRNVQIGKDVISPPYHKAFSTPVELCQFIGKLRNLAGGKPVGIKLCLGKRREFIALCKAMVETKIMPDFITLDGGEGGTGAAPLEFSNYVGFPLKDALIFVRNCLVGYSIKKHIKIIVSGRIITGFDMVSKSALGADLFNSARGMMMSIGCIQALRCNTNHCPTGIATQNEQLYSGLDVTDKRVRCANFHHETVKTMGEILASMGLKHPEEVRPWHIMRRSGPNKVDHYGEIYEFLNDGDLLKKEIPKSFERTVSAASIDSFKAAS